MAFIRGVVTAFDTIAFGVGLLAVTVAFVALVTMAIYVIGHHLGWFRLIPPLQSENLWGDEK